MIRSISSLKDSETPGKGKKSDGKLGSQVDTVPDTGQRTVTRSIRWDNRHKRGNSTMFSPSSAPHRFAVTGSPDGTPPTLEHQGHLGSYAGGRSPGAQQPNGGMSNSRAGPDLGGENTGLHDHRRRGGRGGGGVVRQGQPVSILPDCSR